MRSLFHLGSFLLVLSLLFSCAVKKENTTVKKMTSAQLEQIIDSAKLLGAILIYDEEKKTFYSNDFTWSESGHLPASTFKIPNSMIALETAMIDEAKDTIYYTGEERAFDSWEEDMTLRQAFHRSCLPCYQQLTRKMGYQNMKAYTYKLGYGNLSFDSASFDSFWVLGKSEISQFEQIDFLQRFYHSQLPISNRTEMIVKEMIKVSENGYDLSAKTGWSITEGVDNGWYVGYIEKGGKVYFFATNVSPGPGFERESFGAIRKEITIRGMKEIGIL